MCGTRYAGVPVRRRAGPNQVRSEVGSLLAAPEGGFLDSGSLLRLGDKEGGEWPVKWIGVAVRGLR